MKKTYIIPTVSVTQVQLENHLLGLSGNLGGIDNSPGNGGEYGGGVGVGIKGYNDWDIWGSSDEDYDDDY
ncbi:MAG: hypothetical protein J5671_04460 [Bacteroidaceae bacterium]|nr:hypothetical protein [Bacteroidaceae bacterium]